MAEDTDRAGELAVLRSKRDATRYQILVEIASRQPAVSQQEIADAIGVTAQAVSDYLQELDQRGHVRIHGRGRYEVTKEGVDWLLSQTEELREFVAYVSEEVVGAVEIETAIADETIAEGDRVAMSMREGVLHARPVGDGERETDGATAVAVTDASAGQDIGVTDFAGILEYDHGEVTVLSVPPVTEGGGSAVDAGRVAQLATNADLFAVAGTEALVAARRADRVPDIRFGTGPAITEAATKGLNVLLLATTTELSRLTSTLREEDVSYEVLEDVA